MTSASDLPKFTFFLLAILLQASSYSAYAASCEYGVVLRNKLYSYSLASPVRDLPHGVLSEDGFYRVAANGTIIWFQLCDGMIFNHDPPRCVDCWVNYMLKCKADHPWSILAACSRNCIDCLTTCIPLSSARENCVAFKGLWGPSLCGMGCSALVAKDTGGYYVCTSIGRDFNYDIKLMNKETPTKGVNVTMSSKSQGMNCSLTVSVVCDSNGIKEPQSFEKVGTCDYVTLLKHPSGCAKIVGVRGGGWGWFSILLTILLSFLIAYLLVGVVYRYFFLRIRGLDVIPNLDFWTSIPHRTKSLFMSLVQRFRGPTYHHRSSYSSVNF